MTEKIRVLTKTEIADVWAEARKFNPQLPPEVPYAFAHVIESLVREIFERREKEPPVVNG